MTAGAGGLPVVVAGHICLDIIPALAGADLSGVARPGSLTEVGGATVVAGGAVANTGRALHRLGVATRLVGKVGGDPIGRLTVDLLRGESPVLARHVVVEDGTSGSYSIVLSPAGGDRSFLHHGGANHAFGAADVRPSHLDGAAALHFGYPTLMRRMYADGGSELEELFRGASSAGLTTSLDLATPDPAAAGGRVDWTALLARVLPYVDFFLPAAGELAAVLGRGGAPATTAAVRDLAGVALALGAGAVVLKLGGRGLYLRSSSPGPAGAAEWWRSRELWMPAFSVARMAGTTGAGDAAVAGFLAAWWRGHRPEGALRTAAAVGACCVEAIDAAGGVMGWERTQARLDGGWTMIEAEIDQPGWRCDALGCWHGPEDR